MEQHFFHEKLANGLEVVVEEIPLLRSVSLGLWLTRGSRHEGDDQAGLSHFIEHLVFKGSSSRNCAEIAEAIDLMGGNLDAFTGREYTSFLAKVLDYHFEDALALLADLLLHPGFDRQDIELERGVVLEEIKMVQDSAEDAAHELFFSTFYQGHPLGRSILGSERTVAGFDREAILEFFHQSYRPENLLLAVAGNVKAGEVFSAARRHLEGIETGAVVANDLEPDYTPLTILRERPGAEQVHVLVGANAFGKSDPRRYALDTLNTYLGGSVSSRLFQHIRERKGLAYAVSSFTSTFKDCGLLGIYSATGPDKLEQLGEALAEELRNVAQGEIRESHIERAKSCIKGDVVLGLENTANRMAFLARQMIFGERIRSMDEVLAKLDAVTVDDVVGVASTLFNGNPLTLVALGQIDGREIDIDGLVAP